MASDPIEQSIAFNHAHRIGEDQPILFGMRDGGRHLQFGNDGRPIGEQFREIMIARSPEEDPELRAAMDKALAAVEGLGTRLEKADFLADYVAELLSENDVERNVALLAQLGGEHGLAGAEVSLGGLIAARTGVCRHRSLLFKVFADACDVPCALVRGNYMLPDGSAGGHAWNEVVLENGDRIVVDVMGGFIADLADPSLNAYTDIGGTYLYREAKLPSSFPPPVPAHDEADLAPLKAVPWVQAGGSAGRAACAFVDQMSAEDRKELAAALDRLKIKHDICQMRLRSGEGEGLEAIRVRGASYLLLARAGVTIAAPTAPAAAGPSSYPIVSSKAQRESLLEAPGELLAQRVHIVPPARVVWASGAGVFNPEELIADRPIGPVEPGIALPSILHVEGETAGAVLLDFGREISGCIELGVTASIAPVAGMPQVRIRFGESASEAMSELGDRNSGNDYAVRDQVVTLPWKGTKLIGPSGFRFVRLDAADPAVPVPLRYVRAHAVYSTQEPVGAFECNDDRLNRIWEVGAHTVQLNFQDYLWDGIKRDRLVWAGDIHPMVGVIQAVFGPNPVLPRSLDFIRDMSPSDRWMNGICAFSLWWILVHERWWFYAGDRPYLEAQGDYLETLIDKIAGHVGDDGGERFDGGMRFLDWPSFGDETSLTEGLQALLVLALSAGGRLLRELGRSESAERCAALKERAMCKSEGKSPVKSVLALRSLAGLSPAGEASSLADGGPQGLTAYLGYYVLEALGRLGEMDAALALVRQFWGAMIDRGATSFWEEFDMEWLENSGRIDELTPEGMRDIHGDTGRFGHAGFRKSLCHGWSAGPTAFLTEHVLGIRPLSPGCAKVLVAPKLGDLEWARGRYPTPRGFISVHHRRGADGAVVTQVEAPDGVEIVRDQPGPDYL